MKDEEDGENMEESKATGSETGPEPWEEQEKRKILRMMRKKALVKDLRRKKAGGKASIGRKTGRLNSKQIDSRGKTSRRR